MATEAEERVIVSLKVNFKGNTVAELQIMFESNAYLPPNFLLNADFKIASGIFTPYIFRNAEKRR